MNIWEGSLEPSHLAHLCNSIKYAKNKRIFCFLQLPNLLLAWSSSSWKMMALIFLSLGSKTSESSLTPYFFSQQCAIYLCVQLALLSKYSLDLTIGTTLTTTPYLWSMCGSWNCFHSGKYFLSLFASNENGPLNM